MTVTFTYKNGRERRMTRQEAEVLSRLGRGRYLTKDMRAAPPAEGPRGEAHPTPSQGEKPTRDRPRKKQSEGSQ